MLVRAVLQDGGGDPENGQDAPTRKGRCIRLRYPIEAHVLPVLEDGLKGLIEAVEERQPVVEVALRPKRLLLVSL